VVLLHEQETWLAENAAKINAKVSEGYAAAKRGELVDAEQARRSMDEKKRAWLADNARHDALPLHGHKQLTTFSLAP